MQVIHFDFNGPRSLVTNDDYLSKQCAEDIIEGKSYPLPTWECHPKVIVDLGGHAGEFSVMAKLRWPGAEVRCYEPNPELAYFLVENATKYGFRAFLRGVSVFGGPMTLYKSGYGTVANSTVKRPNQTGEFLEVPTESIIDIMKLKPDVLKIDCEGIEWQLFQAILANDPTALERIQMIYLEFHAAGDRWLIDNVLHHTHDIWSAKIGHAEQGELLYIKRGTVPQQKG